MSAGALQSAIDTLHKDEHVIVLTERRWYDKLEAIICHADKTPKAESPYYSPLSLILHTYGATCTHPNLEVAVTPQGRFEAMMDFCPRVKRQASDFSLTVVLKDPDSPEGGRHRLGGWVEAKPKIRMCTKKAKKNGKASADANADPGKQDLVDGQGGAGEMVSDGRNEQVDPDGRKEQVNLEDKKEQADTEDEEEADTEDEEEVDMEREVEHAEEEVEDAEEKVEDAEEEVEDAEEEVEDAEDEEEDMDAEDEGEDSDTDAEDEEEEMDVEDEVQGRDMAHESNEAGPEHGARSDDGAGFDDGVGFNDGAGPDDSAGPNHSAGPDQDAALDHGAGPDRDTGPNHGIAEPDKENKAEKHDAEKDRTLPNNVTQRLIADLPQLCKQAHYAFDNFKEDVIHAMLTYGMTFSLFRFTRPLNWDSVRGTDDHTRPEAIFSDELILINKEFNPHFKHALHLLTASLGLSYQPSWFQLPSDYQVGTPDLTVANAALTRYEAKLKGEPASPPMKTPPSNVNSPNYQQTAKEAAESVKKLRPKLRSGKGGHVTPKAGVVPAENEATETSEPAHEEEVRADPESSDTDDSPLIHRLRPKSTRSGPATSGASGAAGPSTKDPRSLAGNARTPAFKALVSGVKSKNKFITPKNRGKCTSKARGKARQQENTNSRTEADAPALPALLPAPVNDAPIGDGLGDSVSQVLGHLPTSQAATGDDSRTGAPSRAKSGKRKGRPSSPLEADSPTPDAAEDSAPTLAGPSKKRRLAPQADQQPVDDSAGGRSSISPVEAEVSAGAASARENAAVERVYDPLTAPERARLNPHVYKSSHARRRAAKTAETTATIIEPEFPRRLGPRSASSATAGPSRVRDPPPKERVKNSRK